MRGSKYEVKHPELKGSELHHDLKDDPGKDGDPNHTKDISKDGRTLSETKK